MGEQGQQDNLAPLQIQGQPDRQAAEDQLVVLGRQVLHQWSLDRQATQALHPVDRQDHMGRLVQRAMA